MSKKYDELMAKLDASNFHKSLQNYYFIYKENLEAFEAEEITFEEWDKVRERLYGHLIEASRLYGEETGRGFEYGK